MINQIQDVIAASLAEAHKDLVDDLARLRAAVRLVQLKPAELDARLAATANHIAEHFRFEEQNGYMEVVRKRDPRFGRVIEELREEHRRLTQDLAALHREAAQASVVDNSLRLRVVDWIKQIQQHEERENDLVQEAFNSEISAED
jgi:hemerythrin